MSIASRRERQKAEIRDLILEAAERIVLEEGFDALTIRKIADAIDYAPGTIYLHFESRDAIGYALVERGFTELVAATMPLAAQATGPAERLRALCRAYVRFGIEHPATYRLMFLQKPEIADALYVRITEAKEAHTDGDNGYHGLGSNAFNLLMAVVQEAIDAGIFRPGDPAVIADTIWAWFHGIVALQITCSESMLTDLDRSVELALDGVIKAFAS